MFDVIIIGGGPAGITAGIYAAREKLKTLLIAKDIGGKMAKKAIAIENYPGFEKISGLDLTERFERHLKRQEIDINVDEVVGVEQEGKSFLVFTAQKKQFQSRTVIVASGGDPRPVEVPGEKEFIGRGVSYCTLCDGPLFRDKAVAVIGGGDSGFEAAIFLSKLAKKVYILEYTPEVKAKEANQESIEKNKNVVVLTNVALREIQGGKFVDSIIYEERNSQKQETLKVEGVFIEIGYQPATSFVKDLVEFNQRDEIKIDVKTCETNIPGLFAAGDVGNDLVKQIVVAAGQGAKAAISAYKYIQTI